MSCSASTTCAAEGCAPRHCTIAGRVASAPSWRAASAASLPMSRATAAASALQSAGAKHGSDADGKEGDGRPRPPQWASRWAWRSGCMAAPASRPAFAGGPANAGSGAEAPTGLPARSPAAPPAPAAAWPARAPAPRCLARAPRMLLVAVKPESSGAGRRVRACGCGRRRGSSAKWAARRQKPTACRGCTALRWLLVQPLAVSRTGKRARTWAAVASDMQV